MSNKRKITDDKKIIILENLNFQWRVEEIDQVKKMWSDGVEFKEIIKILNRDGDEIFLLLLHLARRGRIKIREGYIWGIEKVSTNEKE